MVDLEIEKSQKDELDGMIDTFLITYKIGGDGRLVWVSRSYADFFGFDNAQKLIGMDVTRLVHPDDHHLISELRKEASGERGLSVCLSVCLQLETGKEVRVVVVVVDGSVVVTTHFSLTTNKQTKQLSNDDVICTKIIHTNIQIHADIP